ncbi:MAG: 16S rRNA (cytosine(1402)-N(4))-methyltransferase RsmH, partial [Patescibacteria group bacterium]
MHIPVLYNETLKYLDLKSGENFIDCTLGDGGHTLGVLNRTAPNGKVLAIDWDMEMIKRVITRISDFDLRERLILVNDNFANLKKIVNEYNFNNISGVLLDLGMSSFHIDESGRGFSFLKDEPLGMNFVGDNSCNDLLNAEEIINKYSGEKLAEIFREYGGERFARSMARRIVEARKIMPIKTTKELIGVIKSAVPSKYRHNRIHFATRIFQALRIEVNREMENLKSVLPQAFDVLSSGGRLAVISFHSLEDKQVKYFFREKKLKGEVNILTKKPIKPSFEEVKSRAVSASTFEGT